jgi:hypothetical protein
VQVSAVSTPESPGWHWRIVNYAGEIIEESRESFPTIADAVARGTGRLTEMDTLDRSDAVTRNWRQNRPRPRA